MKKVLILCLHRRDRAPSQRFRIEQYLDFLSQNGYEITLSNLINEKDDKIFYRPGNLLSKFRLVLKSIGKRMQELRRAGSYDLIFIQREAFMLGTAYFEKAFAAKSPVIFDFDDSIWLQNVSEANKKLAFLKDASKTSKIIEASKMVFAGNEYLAEYAKKFNDNVVVIPTTIDMDYPAHDQMTSSDDVVCIGWSGSFSTIEHFKMAIPVLQRIKEKYQRKVSFKIIGDGSYYCQELDVKGDPWIKATEIQDLSKLDIGIMPLPDTEWAKGKCGLKGLQYMALGIPCLMSPVGVNADIIQNSENGFLPVNDDEWFRDLSLLIDNHALRDRIGMAGRQTIEERYSVDAWKATYLRYFNEVSGRAK